MPRKRSSSRSSESSVEILNKRSNNKSGVRSRSSSSSSRESYKKSKKSSYRSKKSRSRSPRYTGPKNKISELDEERTKNFDFTDEVNELHSNEKLRQKSINKLEEFGGFKPQSFKSSRSDKKRNEPSKFKSSSSNDNAIFGTSTNFTEEITRNADLLLNPNIFFEDSKIRQNRWKLKYPNIKLEK
ncbi:hypothetical protein BpHYR1_023379 [Brachionus plicatilis]|uniref:Uncharacterized protein n=1 Tax=Brachionus plicatilis TaxID=10195 RepID=A0A3M7QJK6_BRAPC|nr:hypothetical protein BpHYR1_023379 [Brachionus plicatilis]